MLARNQSAGRRTWQVKEGDRSKTVGKGQDEKPIYVSFGREASKQKKEQETILKELLGSIRLTEERGMMVVAGRRT